MYVVLCFCMSSLFTDSFSKRNRNSSHFRFCSSNCTSNALFSSSLASSVSLICIIRVKIQLCILLPDDGKRVWDFWTIVCPNLTKILEVFRTSLRFRIGEDQRYLTSRFETILHQVGAHLFTYIPKPPKPHEDHHPPPKKKCM